MYVHFMLMNGHDVNTHVNLLGKRCFTGEYVSLNVDVNVEVLLFGVYS